MRQHKPFLLFLVQNDWFFHSHRLPLAEAAKAEGFRVGVACKIHTHKAALEAAGVEVFPLHHIGGAGLKPVRELRSFFEICALYNRVRPDIVHHVSLRPVLWGSLAARLLRIPGIVNAVTGLGYLFHGVGWRVRLLRLFIRPFLRLALSQQGSVVIFQNHEDRKELTSANLVRMQNTVLIPGSGVQLERYHHSATRQSPPIILFGARIIHEKGAADLVAAARLLRERGVKVRTLLCGKPDNENPGAISEGTLQGWQQEGAIEWLGHRDDMPDLLAHSDIACLPSYYREGIPKFLIEACASGLPIVTTDMPGCRETVVDGKNGLLIPPRDPVALAHALQTLLENPELRIEYGNTSRKIAVDRFGLDKVVASHLEIYNQQIKPR